MRWSFLFLLSLLSCTPKLEGRYQNINGRVNDHVTFQDEYCQFNYFFYDVSGKYTVDNNYVFVETKSEIGTVSYEIVNDYTLIGQGWVSGTYVKEGYKKEYYKSLQGIYVVTSEKLNVREGPGTRYKALGSLQKGVRVEVIKIENKDWYKVKTASGEFYVYSKYLARESY